MEKNLPVRIVCEGIRYSKSVYRFIEKRVGQWLRSGPAEARAPFGAELALEGSGKREHEYGQGSAVWASRYAVGRFGTSPFFHVTFEREGEGHVVQCHIEVKDGSGRNVWKGSSFGDGPYDALSKCLAHMAVVRVQLPLGAQARAHAQARLQVHAAPRGQPRRTHRLIPEARLAELSPVPA